MNIVFFGSFQYYSAIILKSLIDAPDIVVSAVITTPPMPVGRKQIITKTPVHLLAEEHAIPTYTPTDLNADIPFPQNIDLFLTAGYGKVLPESWLKFPKIASLNLHFSLLPKYRGANPAEWAIMCGEVTTGITLMVMSAKLDGGDILQQESVDILPDDTRETIYQKLYTLGAEKLPAWLQTLTLDLASPKPQGKGVTPYAALLKRQDGFLPWTTIQKHLYHQPITAADLPSKHLQTAFNQGDQKDFLGRLPRAFATFPSLWTIVATTKGDKRMKILSFNPFVVQLEGQTPAFFNQIKSLIIL